MSLSVYIERQARTAHRSPSEAQKPAGNYPKGHIRIHGIDIAIENARGSNRNGIGPDGEPWSVKMPSHYGYIKKTTGADGDHVDVYIGPHIKSPHVFIVHQHDADDGKFDEHKVFIGFASRQQVQNTYRKAFSDGRANERLGHIAEMTVDRFKDWLKTGDHTKTVKRARGGRIAMAAGGGLMSDDDVGIGASAVPTLMSDADVGMTAAPKSKFAGMPDKGRADALARGAAQGLTGNFYDELRGLVEAGGANPHDPASLGSLLKGAYGYWTGDKEAAKRYDAAVGRERQESGAAQEQHPYLSTAGDIAGAVALPIGAGASGATLPARMGRGALTGAGVGALYGAGAGENPTERTVGAISGGALGGVTGGLAPPLVEGAVQGIGRAARPIANTIRGAINPEGEASRRVATALDRDFRQTGPAFTPEETAVAHAAGSPLAVIDAGGETTRALGRSAANTSPEARQALAELTQGRFGTQNERTAEFVQRLTGATGDNPATTEALQAQARAANRPAYAQAYREAPSVWTPELEQISQAPAVQDAIRQATRSGANRAAADGFTPVRNPFEFDAAGNMALRTNPDGSQAVPSLQFWDHVKRNLDDQYNALQRSGEGAAARDVNDLRTQLLNHLDTAAPSYGAARAGAARAFGAQDALEAGANFVSSRMENSEARRALGRMSPAERQLFQQGYASSLMNKIDEMGDRQTVLNKLAQSPADRERLELALGPARSRQLEAFMRVEGIMDRARTAVTGNSTTARQLAELGLAGGAYGLASHGDLTDPRAVATGALVWGLTHGRNRINENVARRVGEMLASNDPAVLNRGIAMIARHTRMFDRLRSMDGFSAKVGGQQSPRGALPLLQGPVPTHAQDEQK